MAEVNKDIERLIVRGLDGELGDDEQLTLDRELIRNPDAHRLMEEYKRIDELSAAALDQALAGDRLPLDPDTLPSRSQSARVRRHHRGWWLVPGTIAAAVLAVMVARYPVTQPSDSRVADRASQRGEHAPSTIRDSSHPNGLMRTVGDAPFRTSPSIKRNTGREVLGVLGEDGNIYWIEVDRIRTVKRSPLAAPPQEL